MGMARPAEGVGMPKIIDLNKMDLPYCKTCTDPTKRVLGSTMDIEGPGIPGVIYSCENRKCSARRYEIAKYIMRVEKSNGKIYLF